MSWYTLPGLPSDLLSAEKEDVRRLKVEQGSTGFEQGFSFRLPYEYSFGSTPVVLRFTASEPFTLKTQNLSCDQGGVVFKAYREGTEGGTWTELQTFANNLCKPQARAVQIHTGGTFTPAGPATDVLRVRAAGATAQRANVGNGLRNERRLTAGTYYLVLSRMTGVNEDCKGVYLIEWEESCA